MIIGIVADSHGDKDKALGHIIKELLRRGAKMIIHCGDIERQHVNAETFGGLPVICALVEHQENEEEIFRTGQPPGWNFTKSNDRIRKLPEGTTVYVGHKRHMDFLLMSEEEFSKTLTELRQKFDGLRLVFGGHLHFQTFKKGQLVSFINPGAIEDALGWGYEFAIYDTETRELVFSRLLPTPDDRQTFSVGVISDSLDITHRDGGYWSRLVKEMEKRDATHIIHCGNLALTDIGRPELSNIEVHYAIRADQVSDHKRMVKEQKIPANWKVISETNLETGSVVVINGYHFYVELDLGLKILTMSELSMDNMSMEIRRKHPQVEFVLCGFTREALFVEGQQAMIINPGDTNISRNFAVICLPRREITFGCVPYATLPPL